MSFDFAAVAAYLGAHPTLGRDLAVELGYDDYDDKLLGPCPWHSDRKPSSVVFAPAASTTGRWLVWDQPCGKRRDILDLLARRMGLPDTKDGNYRLSLSEGCRRLGINPRSIGKDSVPPLAPPRLSKKISDEQSGEIAWLYRALAPLTAPRCETAPHADAVRTWMRANGLQPEALEGQARGNYRPAGILPLPARWTADDAWPGPRKPPAWTVLGDQGWHEDGHLLVVTRWDHRGRPGWPKARSIEGDPWLKSLGPKGGSSRGLVGANLLYWRLLCLGPEAFMATWREGLAKKWTPDEHPTLALCEGEKDGLALAGIAPKDALVGWIDSGAWAPEHAARIPDGARVLVLTDSDGAGMRYQAEIAETLRSRCPVRVLNPTEDYRRGTDGAYLLDEHGQKIKLPDVADLVRDGAAWDDLVRRASAWVPTEAETAAEPAVDREQGDDLAAICAKVHAEVPSLSTELPSLSMPAQAPTVAPTVALPAALPAAPTGRSEREVMDAGLRYLHGAAQPQPTAKAEAKPQPQPTAKAEAKPQPQPAKAQPAAKVELDPSDPRRAVCERLGEGPLVTIREGHGEPLVYITSRCCPPEPGSDAKRLSLYVVKPSGDLLAKCWECGGKAFPARLLRPLTQPVPREESAAKTEPKPKATPKPKTAPQPATKAEPQVAEPAEPGPSSALEAVITAALAGGPVLREAVVAQIRAAGFRPTKAQLREARDAAGVRSYTLRDEQWWELRSGDAPAASPAAALGAAAPVWVN